VLSTLGIEKHDGDGWTAWGFEFFVLEDPTFTRLLHIAFTAATQEHVHTFWETGTTAGYRSDGEPGLRPEYHPDYYGGFLLDPEGNSAEACTGFRDAVGGPPIDHLWLGVRDLAVSRRFWETVAPVLSLNVTEVRGTRFHVWADDRSFALVADGRPPTEDVHLAFPVATDETVAEFHRVATDAGYGDNGGPGERSEYHPGYVGAFVLDPDGNNVEAVNHNR